MHAVKLDYNHLKFQRNQIYGNLWYEKSKKDISIPWQKLDIFNSTCKNDVQNILRCVSDKLSSIKQRIKAKL